MLTWWNLKTPIKNMRVSNTFWLIFHNGSEFKKQDFLPLLKDFAVKPKPATIKKPQCIKMCAMDMINTKHIAKQVFKNILDPWGEIFSFIAWMIYIVFARGGNLNLSKILDFCWIISHRAKDSAVYNSLTAKLYIIYDLIPNLDMACVYWDLYWDSRLLTLLNTCFFCC